MVEIHVPPSMAGHEEAWHELSAAILRHAAAIPERLQAALATAPCSPAVHAAKGLMLMLAGRREAREEAHQAHAHAARLVSGVRSAHDEVLVAALGDWLAGAPSAGAARLERWLDDAPGDALALKLAQAIRFIVGDAVAMRACAERHAPAFCEAHPFAGYVQGCLAFAREETFAYEGALTAGRRALELASDDAWGLHALAHVHEMTGRAREGRDLIAANGAAYAGCSTFRHHVEWHAALFHLELGEPEAALGVYDTAVRCEATDDYRDVANAVSLLARLAGDGVDVGSRWDELADLAERRIGDGCIVFADLHYLMALLATGRTEAASRLGARLAGEDDGTELGRVAVEAGAPAAAGLAAASAGRHEAALHELLRARPAFQRIGGSHAQRDVFVRITIDAAVRAERFDTAARLIEERAAERGHDRFARSRLARCPSPVPS